MLCMVAAMLLLVRMTGILLLGSWLLSLSLPVLWLLLLMLLLMLIVLLWLLLLIVLLQLWWVLGIVRI